MQQIETVAIQYVNTTMIPLLPFRYLITNIPSIRVAWL